MTTPVLTDLRLMPDTQVIRADFSDKSHFLVPIRDPHDRFSTAYALRVLADYLIKLEHLQ